MGKQTSRAEHGRGQAGRRQERAQQIEGPVSAGRDDHAVPAHSEAGDNEKDREGHGLGRIFLM